MTTAISVGQQEHYGCYQTPRAAGYFAPDRLYLGVFYAPYKERITWIEDTTSRDCRYDRKETDKRCEGCGK